MRHKKFSLFGPITQDQYKMHLTAKCTVFPKIEELSQVGNFLKDETLPGMTTWFGTDPIEAASSSKPSMTIKKPYRLR